MGVQMQIASVALTMFAAREQKKAYELEAESYQEQGKMAAIQASQQESERNRRLRSQLSTLNNAMAGQGVALGTSSSVEALARDEEKIALADISSIKLMGLSQRRKYGISAASAKAGGRAAVLGGFSKSAQMGYDIYTGKKSVGNP
jgi:hypothetical protein